MDLVTCSKYLDFVVSECDRHLDDGRISDDEVIQMVIELNRFKEKCSESDLPEDVKEKLNSLKFDYTLKGMNRSYWTLLAAIVTFGFWAYIAWYRNQQRRKRAVIDIKGQVSNLAIYLKMNY